MLWKCNNCGLSGSEYAYFENSSIADGCPKCGHKQFWFTHLANVGGPESRVLVNTAGKTYCFDNVEDARKFLGLEEDAGD